VYTLSTMLFLLYRSECRPVPHAVQQLFSRLGDYTYPIYLVHPVFLSLCTALAAQLHIYQRAIHIIGNYIIVV
ncbi:acyltransferase, partial [Megasphaera massiliensis]|nr:acyltransferase [Megasphaera massiliensis]